MADEDPCSTRKKDLHDFPPVNLLHALISSFPKEWHGIFAALNSEHLPVQAASFWLQKTHANEKLSDIPPNFIDLIAELVNDFPVVLNDKLFFKPKILLLPLNIQRTILAFLAHRSCSVPVESLDKLVHSLSKLSTDLDGWGLTYLKIIESKARHLKESCSGVSQDSVQSHGKGNNLLHIDLMTDESKARFEDLIKKNKLAESSTNIPWFKSASGSEIWGGNINGNIPGRVPSFRGKDDHQGDIDMVDLTEDVHAQSDNTLQRVHAGSSDVFGDSDLEIIEVIENPPKEITLEHDGDVLTELTVPPPPKHVIIDNEDISEQLIMKTEDVPEHMITKEDVTVDCKLSNTLQQKISALQDLLQSSECNEQNFSNELEVFSSCSSLEMECICTQLNLKGIQESLAISLCQQFIILATEPSLGSAAVFAMHCLLPKVQGLNQAASRVLLSAVTQFAKKHSRAFCDGVVIKIIQQSNLDTPQVDLVNKIIKECFSEDTRVHLMQLILSLKSTTEGHPFMWTESTVSVVQTVVDLKPEISGDLFGTFATVLEQQSRHLSKSLVYAKMLLAVIKTYGQHVSLHVNSLVSMLELNETFLKKAGLSALRKSTKN